MFEIRTWKFEVSLWTRFHRSHIPK